MFQLIHISISIVDIIVCICIVALLSVLFWFAILKCDRDKYIESSIQNGIQLIDMVLEQEPFDVSTPYISILKENAHENIKLCRLLATRDNVLKLINILKRGELIWRNKMTPKIPLTDKQVSDYFDIQYSNCLMYDCSELMNHLLPQFKDVGDIPFKEIVDLIDGDEISILSRYHLITLLSNLSKIRRDIHPVMIENGFVERIDKILKESVGRENLIVQYGFLYFIGNKANEPLYSTEQTKIVKEYHTSKWFELTFNFIPYELQRYKQCYLIMAVLFGVPSIYFRSIMPTTIWNFLLIATFDVTFKYLAIFNKQMHRFIYLTLTWSSFLCLYYLSSLSPIYISLMTSISFYWMLFKLICIIEFQFMKSDLVHSHFYNQFKHSLQISHCPFDQIKL